MPGSREESRDLLLALKLIADAGLIGLPNAGKSTFLATVTRPSRRSPTIRSRRLHPQLGVVARGRCADFVLADLPGPDRGRA